jgi:hypothetical protein
MVGNFIAVMMAKTVHRGGTAMQHYEAGAVGFHSSVLTFTVARDICVWCDFRIIIHVSHRCG